MQTRRRQAAVGAISAHADTSMRRLGSLNPFGRYPRRTVSHSNPMNRHNLPSAITQPCPRRLPSRHRPPRPSAEATPEAVSSSPATNAAGVSAIRTVPPASLHALGDQLVMPRDEVVLNPKQFAELMNLCKRTGKKFFTYTLLDEF